MACVWVAVSSSYLDARRISWISIFVWIMWSVSFLIAFTAIIIISSWLSLAAYFCGCETSRSRDSGEKQKKLCVSLCVCGTQYVSIILFHSTRKDLPPLIILIIHITNHFSVLHALRLPVLSTARLKLYLAVGSWRCSFFFYLVGCSSSNLNCARVLCRCVCVYLPTQTAESNVEYKRFVTR